MADHLILLAVLETAISSKDNMYVCMIIGQVKEIKTGTWGGVRGLCLTPCNS